MKIKNILALLCFLCIGVSCSMEDDILSGVDTKGPAGIDATELYASLDLSLLVGNSNVTTKSSELTGPTDGTEENMTKDERSVSDCYIAIFKYDSKTKNVGDFLTSYYSSNGSISESLIFKIPKDKSERTDLKIVVIANAAASVSKYGLASASQISYADLKGKTLVETPNAFVKVGETDIAKGDGTYPDGKGGVYVNISEKILNLDQPDHTPVEIKLIQRTAAIVLQRFQILKSDGSAYDDVAITRLSLENCKAIGKVAGEVSSGEQLYREQSVDDNFTERLYSYENTSITQPTTLKIDYVYNNGETGSCSFPIKSRLNETSDPSIAVWAGYLYKLEVTLKNAAVDVTVQCVTQDWIFDKDHKFEFTF